MLDSQIPVNEQRYSNLFSFSSCELEFLWGMYICTCGEQVEHNVMTQHTCTCRGDIIQLNATVVFSTRPVDEANDQCLIFSDNFQHFKGLY